MKAEAAAAAQSRRGRTQSAQPAAKDSAEPEPPKPEATAARSTGRRASDGANAPSEFKLPELGENISQGDLVRLMISPGTKVSEGQPVMELETDKAVVEVPSSVNGVVKEVRVKEGEKVKVGQVIFTLEGGASAPANRGSRSGRTQLRPTRRAAGVSGCDPRRRQDRRRSAAAGSAFATGIHI